MEFIFSQSYFVEVLKPSEILKTLDSKGTLNNLPFMPEMIKYCGKRFKVGPYIEKTCVVSNGVKGFARQNIVFLESLRCDGSCHDNCQAGCMIFWNKAWLKEVDSDSEKTEINAVEARELKSKLKTKVNHKTYFCQSTQLNKATIEITAWKRFLMLFREMKTKSVGILKALNSIVFPIWWRLRIKELYGSLSLTPDVALDLQPGELVEVKSFNSIRDTLDKHGRNKGLEFHYDMKKYCGKRLKVKNRIDRLINESNGKMMNLKNTVILEDVTCDYAYRFLGCTRSIYKYWREIWLKRIN